VVMGVVDDHNAVRREPVGAVRPDLVGAGIGDPAHQAAGGGASEAVPPRADGTVEGPMADGSGSSSAVAGGPHGLATAPRPTGDTRVDEALARLSELSHKPVAEHVEIFDDVRSRLHDVLASMIDQDGPRPPAPPRP
jgi:hypothetical protein